MGDARTLLTQGLPRPVRLSCTVVSLRCDRCGVVNREGARFCMSCGAPLVPMAAAVPATQGVFTPPPPSYRHEHDRFGIVGLAFFLLSIGVIFAANPNLASELRLWTSDWTTLGPLVRPPQGVITSAALFFAVEGVLMFVLAWIRVALRDRRMRATSTALQGIGDLVFAYLLVLYADRLIGGPFVIAVLAGVVGALLMIWVSLGLYWNAWPWMTEGTGAASRP